MPKRDPDIEAIDESPVEAEESTVGERLRAAREAKGLSVDDIAAQTRIPQRHLEALERSEWDSLPAPTYTTGFAKSYASAVGLDRTEIGDQLRAEMGGQRFTSNALETFEPADPRRTMPKWLVIGTIVGLIVLVALMTWLNNRALEQPEDGNPPTATAPASAPVAKPAEQQVAAPAANAPVTIAATDAVWLQVSQKGGPTLFSGILQPGKTFAIPPTATAPLLKTGKPEALRISVGNQVAPPVGPPAKKVSNVSLLPADLMKGPSAAAPAAAPAQRKAAAPAPAATTPTLTPPAEEAATNAAE